jgi:hypothetical protein
MLLVLARANPGLPPTLPGPFLDERLWTTLAGRSGLIPPSCKWGARHPVLPKEREGAELGIVDPYEHSAREPRSITRTNNDGIPHISPISK